MTLRTLSMHCSFQSTPPMRRATSDLVRNYDALMVSIHAPHAEGDEYTNPHSMDLPFQSTPPMRRATLAWLLDALEDYVSIHAPHAEGDMGWNNDANRSNVSIHAPHAEGDNRHPDFVCIGAAFQSTPPMRRATVDAADPNTTVYMFQSTPPMRRATWVGTMMRIGVMFQSTPPMRRATSPCRASYRSRTRFNPRPPCGGRRQRDRALGGPGTVSIHAPHAEGDPPRPPLDSRPTACFNPRPPCGGRRHQLGLSDGEEPVSIHAPHAEGDIAG